MKGQDSGWSHNRHERKVRRRVLFEKSEVAHAASGSPVVTEMLVVPVAGDDSMLLNLSGAHGPYFTRNIVVRIASPPGTSPSPLLPALSSRMTILRVK